MSDPDGTGLPDDAAAVLEAGADAPCELLRLTDADLLAVDGMEAPAVAPLLWLGKADRELQVFAADVARRGLAAHQINDDSLSRVLGMRRTAVAILIAQQRTAVAVAAVVVYVHRGGAALVEEVDGDGLHRFVATRVGTALTELRDWTTPLATAADVDAPTRSMSPQEWEDSAAAVLADARAVTVLAGVRAATEAAEQRRLTVYALPDRTEVVEGDPEVLTATQVSRASLLDRLAALVGL